MIDQYTAAVIHCAAYTNEATAKVERALLRATFLDYFNNFLTVAAFADHYGIQSETAAKAVLNLGRTLHNDYPVDEVPK